MGAGRKKETYTLSENIPWSSMPSNSYYSCRGLSKSNLGGVIFGCTHDTMAECFSKKLFGLPYGHFSYVRNINTGLPLFLFNFTDRKLHGIYEATTHGQLYINACAWADGGLGKTPYPAQVSIRIRAQCKPLNEDQYKNILEKNYYSSHHFWFELDHAQTKGLIALFKPSLPLVNNVQSPLSLSKFSAVPASLCQAKKSVDVLSKEENFPSLRGTTCKEVVQWGVDTSDNFPSLRCTTWKEAVQWGLNTSTGKRAEDLKPSNNLVNENKLVLMPSDNGASSHTSPRRTLSSVVEFSESKEAVSDWEELAEDNVQTISSGGSPSSHGAKQIGQKRQSGNEESEKLEQRVLHKLEKLAADRQHLVSSSKGCIDDGDISLIPGSVHDYGGQILDEPSVSASSHTSLRCTLSSVFEFSESKEAVSDWEELAEDNVQNISSGGSPSAYGAKQIGQKRQSGNEESVNLEQRVLHKLEKLAADRQHLVSSSKCCIDDSDISRIPGGMHDYGGQILDEPSVSAKKQKIFNTFALHNENAECGEMTNASYMNLGVTELVQVIKKLEERTENLEKRQVDLDQEVLQLKNLVRETERKNHFLKDCVKELESKIDHSLALTDDSIDKFVEHYLGSDDVIYLIGGFDGSMWLSSLDCFLPSLDILTPLKPMISARSFLSAVALDGILYVFGGCIDSSWFDTVEYYNRRHDEWMPCTPMLSKKGSLAGATLNGKIYAIGGGDGVECFSNVETYDPALDRWNHNQSMMHKRFAPAAAELKGAIYSVGGYDGNTYLRSTEKFDPREGYWSELPNMNVRRGSHSVAVLNEKLYCIGGYDGEKMVSSVEVYDPRLNAWVMWEPMKFVRGYASVAVLGNSLFAIGGVQDEKIIVDTVEYYKEGTGWTSSGWKAIGNRCFSSAIVL